MDKPREFWLKYNAIGSPQTTYTLKEEPFPYYELHVIEYSAYEHLVLDKKDLIITNEMMVSKLKAEREKNALQSQIIEDLMGALDELKVYLGELTVTSDPYAPTIVECFIEKPLDAAQAKLKLIRGNR